MRNVTNDTIEIGQRSRQVIGDTEKVTGQTSR